MIGGRIVQLLESIITGGSVKLAAGNNNIGQVGIDQTTDGTTNRVVAKISQVEGENLVQLSGSNMELYGAVIGDRPAANTVAAGTTFTIVDDTQDFKTWMSNGVDWGEEI